MVTPTTHQTAKYKILFGILLLILMAMPLFSPPPSDSTPSLKTDQVITIEKTPTSESQPESTVAKVPEQKNSAQTNLPPIKLDPLELLQNEALHGESLVNTVLEPRLGDLNGMKERKIIRVLTSLSPTSYYLESGVPNGLTVEAARGFEKYINKRFKGSHINVVVMAVPIEQLFDWLKSGHGDIIASNITVTEERSSEFSFSDPFIRNVSEQVTLGPSVTEEINSLDDLAEADIEIMVHDASSFAEHLKKINATRKSNGKKLLRYRPADNHLYPEDMLELVSSGMVDATVMDSHMLPLWQKVFTNLTAPKGVTIHSQGNIAWVTRKDSPKLVEVINDFVPKYKQGSLLGNIMAKRHLKSRDRVKNALNDISTQALEKTVASLKKHAKAYDFDWLLLAAQGYQESRLNQRAKSSHGAIGIMQVLPSTAKEPYINIKTINTLDGNIEAGTKYNRWLIDTYFSDPDITPFNQTLFGLAAYNAGPGNLKKARKYAKKMKLNPNVWFNNVEVAMGKYISKEPVAYVRNIYKIYAVYRLYKATLENKYNPNTG